MEVHWLNQTLCFYKSSFIDETILALKIDGTENFALFINETKYGKEINNLLDLQKYIESKYIKTNNQNQSSGLFYKPEKIKDIEVDNICPACKYNGVSNIQIYPNCGLHFV